MRWRLAKLNWSYGLGELLIVVAGVLIALAVDQWNTNRLIQIEEVEIIERLISDLKEDLQGLESQSDSVHSKESSLLRVRLALIAGDAQPDDAAGFLRDIINGANYGWNQFDAKHTTYAGILGSGKFSLIQSADIRVKVADYFDTRTGNTRRIDERETQFPHMSYRLVLRENEGSYSSDDGGPRLDSSLSSAEIEQLVARVFASPIKGHIDAEINLARFILNRGLVMQSLCRQLIDQLEIYRDAIR